MIVTVFPFGRYNAESDEFDLIPGKLATVQWIEASAFQKIPHSTGADIDDSALSDGVYILPKQDQ